MQVRRIVTGHTPDGKATVASDMQLEGTTIALAPGAETHRLWGADETPAFPNTGSAPAASSHYPAEGGFRFLLATIPPDSDMPSANVDMDAALIEMEEKMPGLMAHLEPDSPGMHTSDTIDFQYVVSGEVWLELDDGEEVHLKAGDTIVQNGTRHAWRNRSNEPCRMVVCMIGGNRSK